MKTEANVTTDTIWTTTVDIPHLTNEECLPVIGGCQVSSILSNLDASDKVLQNNIDLPQNMDLIVLQSNDFKIPTPVELTGQITNEFLVFKENTSKPTEDIVCDALDINKKPKKSKKEKIREDFEDMLYFVCNLCPYLCTRDSKITEHLENAHKNKTINKLMQLKCPACPNIFYHKVSLRSHLIHDHEVGSSDLSRIVQAVVYFSKKNLNNSNKLNENNKDQIVSLNNSVISCKNEIDLKYIEKLTHSEKIINNEDSLTDDSHDLNSTLSSMDDITPSLEPLNNMPFEPDAPSKKKIEKAKGKRMPEIVNLPTIDIMHNDPQKMFTNIIKQQSTLSKYLDQKNHKCVVSMCKVRLQDIYKMNYHVKCHAENSFKCLECSEVFSFWKPLTGHLWRIHKIDMELYSCDKCDYKTFSLGKLNNIHKLIHSDLKAFICDVCQKGFKNSKQLRNHRITHKEKSLKMLHFCEICEKSFSDKRQLRVHTDGVHKKIKPFLCSYCGYKGASKSALKMHVRQHTGEKPFSCNSCIYSTADHNSLRRHKLRHSGEKPYKCAHCDYACIQSSTYKVHLRAKHPGLEKDLMFSCSECQFRTINKEMYLAHLTTEHSLPVSSLRTKMY